MSAHAWTGQSTLTHGAVAPPTRPSRGLSRIRRETTVPRPLEETFAFFADARKLDALTPPWVGFRILTPTPIDMRRGTLATGCSTSGKPTDTGERLRAEDIDALTGPAWSGTLAYLDYRSGRHTTIDSSVIVRRVGDSPPAWEFGVGYSKEPHADAKEVVALSSDGRSLGNERLILRELLPGSGVRFVAERDGEDDHRAARFRFEHTVTPREYTRTKLVRFNSESEFFERHTYRWTR